MLFTTRPYKRSLRLTAGLLSTLLAAGALTGCQDAGQPTAVKSVERPDLTPAQMDAIRAEVARDWNVSEDEVYFTATHVAVSDVLIPLENFRNGGLAKTAQRRHELVSQTTISYVRVYTAVSGLKPQIDEAIQMWNKSGAKIYFLRVESGPAEVTVSETSETSSGGSTQYLAYAVTPSSGKPGSYVKVRNYTGTDLDWPKRTPEQRVNAMAHELGHTIGFAHTNSSDGTHITGTPDKTDAESIMGTSNSSTHGMTYYDKQAARALYPLDRMTEKTALGDVNGDGQKDLIIVGDNGITVALKKPGLEAYNEPEMWHYQFARAQGWDITKHPILFGDFDGNGLMDVLGIGQSQVIVALATGTGFRSEIWSTNFSYDLGWRRANNPILVGDFNGDGKADLVGFANAGAIVGLSTGTSFSASYWLMDMGYNQGWRTQSHPRLVGDFNGDGKDDIVGFANAGAIVGVSNGSSFTTSFWLMDMGVNAGWSVANNPRLVGDFNCDNKDDIVGFANAGAIVGVSNGSSFTTSYWLMDMGYNQGWRTDKHVRAVGNFDGNCGDDLIGFFDANTVVATSNGSSKFNAPKSWISNFGYNQGYRLVETPRLIGETTGDGLADVVALSQAQFLIGKSTGLQFRVTEALKYKPFP